MKARLYIRKKRGQIGIRNHVLIVPTTSCVNSVVEAIGKKFTKVKWGDHDENRVIPVTHGAGCCHVSLDEDIAFRVLLGTITHPNIGGVLLVSLGCGQLCKVPATDKISRKKTLMGFTLYRRAMERGLRNIAWLNVMEPPSEEGGTEAAEKLGEKLVNRLIDRVSRMSRSEHPVGDLTVAVLNGASDSTSGLYSNRAVGYFVDWFILNENGTVVFSQLTEILGAEEYLLSKATESAKRKLKRALETAIAFRKGLSREMRMSDPTPGNIRAGISTLAEKSIGSVLKAGMNPAVRLKGVIAYGMSIPHRGLFMMEGPGHDLTALTGMAVGGAQIALFTTGLGTPLGHALVPVIKITANESTYRKMRPNIDVFINPEEIYRGKSLKEYSVNLLKEKIINHASGIPVKAEEHEFFDYTVRSMWMLQ